MMFKEGSKIHKSPATLKQVSENRIFKLSPTTSLQYAINANKDIFKIDAILKPWK